MRGHVYIIVNDRAHDRVKVGRTNDLARRLAQHNRASNSVGRWSYHEHWEVSDARAAESAALAALRPHRVGSKRELFSMRPAPAARTVRRAIAPWRDGMPLSRIAWRNTVIRLALAALIAGLAVLIVTRPGLMRSILDLLEWNLPL